MLLLGLVGGFAWVCCYKHLIKSMSFWDFFDKYKFLAGVFLLTVFLGYNAESIIMALPFVDKNLLWVLLPFVFCVVLLLGISAYHESRISKLEDKLGGQEKQNSA